MDFALRSIIGCASQHTCHGGMYVCLSSLVRGSKLTKSIGCLSITSVKLEDLPLTHQLTNLVFAIWNLNLPAAIPAIRQATLLCTSGMRTTERKSA